jgi:hypothetical protein
MRLHRPVLAGLALGALLPVTAASAATGVAAAGSATSSATLASVTVGSLTIAGQTIQGHSVAIGTLSAAAQTLSASQAPSVTFTPLTVDGVGTAATTVTPANSPKTVGGVSTGALPLNVLSATSPSATLSAAAAASRTASLTSKLGSVKVLGMPVTLNGGVSVGSVTDASHAQAGKTLSITNVSLPNLADLLAALGIDISKLPVGTLNGLVQDLPVTLSAATQTALQAANDAIDTTATAKGAAQAAYDTAAAQVTTTAAALDTALSGADLTGVTLPSNVTAPLDHTDWDTMTQDGTVGTTAQTAIVTLNPAVGTAAAAYDAAKSDASTKLDTLSAAIDALTAALGTLSGLVSGVLSGTPLVQVGAANVGTRAAVSSAKVADVTGYVSGVKVLGEDVLQTVTGNSKLDAAKLIGDTASQVNAELADLAQTLSGVLSGVTGAAGLVVPAPSIQLLTKATSTGTSGAFGLANATVTALSVSLGSVTVPLNFALPGAAQQAGIGATSTGFKTAPLSVKVGVLGEAARFRPASTTSGPSGGGSLPATGLPAGIAIVALIGTAGAFAMRRRLRTTD